MLRRLEAYGGDNVMDIGHAPRIAVPRSINKNRHLLMRTRSMICDTRYYSAVMSSAGGCPASWCLYDQHARVFHDLVSVIHPCVVHEHLSSDHTKAIEVITR